VAAVHHKFTFSDQHSARHFVWKVVREINKGALVMMPIYVEDNIVHVLDADQQSRRLADLARSSSATRMKAIRLPYPSTPSME
jgi:hypothetical protein